MVWDTFVIWNTLLSIVLIMLFHNLNWRAGRCQYEWIILSRVSTRSLFVGWQYFLFTIACLIAFWCSPSYQCSATDNDNQISHAFVHLGTLSYSASPLVEELHPTFSNCRFKQTIHRICQLFPNIVQWIPPKTYIFFRWKTTLFPLFTILALNLKFLRLWR